MQLDRLATKQRPAPPLDAASIRESQLVDQSTAQPQLRRQDWRPSRGEWPVLITMGLSSFLTALDAGILVAVLPLLAVALNGTALQTFWAGTSYLLANAASQPFIGALSDTFGRRELLIPSIGLFTVGSVICGTASNFPTLLAGRTIQGIGGGGMMTLAQLVFADIVPLRLRPRYFTIVLGAWAMGIMLGPALGGVFAERITWRWCFYINLPFCAVALVMTLLFMKLVPIGQRTYRQKIRSMDWTGCSLFVTAITTFLFALSSAGVAYSWNSWRTIVPLVLGTCVIIATLCYERYWATEPFLTHSLFQNASSIINYVAALFQGFLLYSTLYYLTFYLAATHLVGPVMAGVNLLPALVFCMVGSPATSALITRFGTYRWAVWLGYLVTTVGCGACITLNEHSSQLVYSTIFATIGTGLGIILAAVNFATQASVANAADSGKAAVMYALMRGIGMCLGVAIAGTIFVNAMRVKLASIGLSTGIAENAESYVEEVMLRLASNDPLRISLLRAYAAGFRGVFIGMTAISASTLLLTLAMKEFTLDKVSDSRFSVIAEHGRTRS